MEYNNQAIIIFTMIRYSINTNIKAQQPTFQTMILLPLKVGN